MIKIIGMGPGNIKCLTNYAIDTIKNAHKVIAFGRIAKGAKVLRDDIVCVRRVDEITTFIEEDKTIAILASGDPCFYGILEYLKKKGIVIDEVVSGISSFQYMMSKLQKSWQHAKLISMHGRNENLNNIKDNKVVIILTDSENTPEFISKRLYDKGLRGKLYVGYNLSYDNESIIEKRIGEDIENNIDISLVVVEFEVD